ncbi:MAG: hypothetical protein Q8P12_04560 [bacterium]|nr:hypothetical protein [bacterium]
MPRTKDQQRQYMRDFMAKKRAKGNVSTDAEVSTSMEEGPENVSFAPKNLVSTPEKLAPPVSPSLAFPRVPGKCIRCGKGISQLDNFCSDPCYAEHLAWLRLPVARPTGRRWELRASLDSLRQDYVDAARRQDWERCDEVNREREPLFLELAKLEEGQEDRYWLPARILSKGAMAKK